MERFEIKYEDPETLEEKTGICEFEDNDEVTAMEWAKDWAYTLARKGYYTLKKVHELN